MKHLFLVLSLGLLISSCGNETETSGAPGASGESNNSNSSELEALRKENETLRIESATKDSIIIETSQIFTEISDNLSKISYKRGEIRNKNLNAEIGEDPKAWIMQEINAINELRIVNAKKVGQLNKLLKDKEGIISGQQNTIDGLNAMVEALNNEIMVQDQENESLKVQLEILDKDYADIFDSYIAASDKAETLQEEVNKAYYAYGTKKELKSNGVITKEGSFIGLGGAKKLKSDFNDEYFERIDILQSTEIKIEGKRPKLITSHPSSSYTLDEGDGMNTLNITDPEKFWGATKYLVIVVQ